jgi:hypothetical protein
MIGHTTTQRRIYIVLQSPLLIPDKKTGNRQTDLFCRLEINHQLKLRRLLPRSDPQIVVDSGLLTCRPSFHKDGVVLSYETGGSSLLRAHL